MLDVQRLDVAWYPVADWERAKRFYGDVLALKPVFGDDDMGWQEFQVGEGPTHLAISRADGGGAGKRGGATAIIAVRDVERARGHLVERGVRCDDVQVIPNVVKLCTFYDPDGNQLQLAQALG